MLERNEEAAKGRRDLNTLVRSVRRARCAPSFESIKVLCDCPLLVKEDFGRGVLELAASVHETWAGLVVDLVARDVSTEMCCTRVWKRRLS